MACQKHCPERPNHIHDHEALRLLTCGPAITGRTPATKAIAEARALIEAARARKEA